MSDKVLKCLCNSFSEAGRAVSVHVSGREEHAAATEPHQRVHQVSTSKEMFYLTTHSTHFIYGYMALDIW